MTHYHLIPWCLDLAIAAGKLDFYTDFGLAITNLSGRQARQAEVTILITGTCISE
jgi:hypothetical protein